MSTVLLYLNVVLSWSEDDRSRPKHVAKYNLIVIIASCLDICCVLTAHNKQFDIHNGMASIKFTFYAEEGRRRSPNVAHIFQVIISEKPVRSYFLLLSTKANF